MDGRPVRRIVVLGGGSAGWLTAGLLAAAHGHRIAVTVVEAPDIPTIGVGEGTWPTMRDSLRDIGVDEADFVRACDAAFKQGSLFVQWRRGDPADWYLHPFTLPQGHGEAPLVEAWLAQPEPAPFAAVVTHQTALCLRGLAPKQTTTPAFASVLNYGYHFDAGRLGPFLRAHCTERLGVRHVADEVVAARSLDNGDIAALQTRQRGEVEGDLFIDCSGLRSRLLGGHFGVGFVSCRDVLFCDSALALQLPHAEPDAPVACQTVATAQAGGWVWDIGLQSRRGVGVVYSSAHWDDAAAARALEAYVEAGGGAGRAGEPRRLRFDPGYRRSFWHRNCVAIGLAAGFVEPLEASAIAMVEFAAAFVRDQLPATRAAMDTVARCFDAACRYRWERIVDFLKLHYALSERDDGAFWRDNRDPATLPARLAEQLALWREVVPSRRDFERHDEPFPSASHQYVLYGMGFRPDRLAAPRPEAIERARGCFAEAAALARRMLPALPAHRALLEHVRQHGLHRI